MRTILKCTLLAIALLNIASYTQAANQTCLDLTCGGCTADVGCGWCAPPTGGIGACRKANGTKPLDPTSCEPIAWISNPTQCAAMPCSTPQPIEHASFGSCSTVTGWTLSGNTCSFQCDDGYSSVGDSELTCNDGEWSGNMVCSSFDPTSLLPASNFQMKPVDWFLLFFCATWSLIVLLLAILLLSGGVLPHLGSSPPNLTLWDLDAVGSKLQRQQRCRRWLVGFIGNAVVALSIAALATDQYSTATFPSDDISVSIVFRAFGYTLTAGDPIDIDETTDYPSCSNSDGQGGSSTLCYLLRATILGSFCFGVLGAIACGISVFLIALVLLRIKKEIYWKHAMKFNLVATMFTFTTTLVYASTAHVILKQLYSSQFQFELSTSWFLFLGTFMLSGLFSCMTYLYYRPTATDEDEDDGMTHGRKIDADDFITAQVRGGQGGSYGAMREEKDPFA